MEIKYFTLILFTLFNLTISCKDNAENKKNNLTNINVAKNTNAKLNVTKKDSLNINFLDEKYQINGFFIPDNSPSFPSYNHLDDKIGLFSVDFIGKTYETQYFWDVYNKNGYFSKYQNHENAAFLSKDIKKLINMNDYYVLASYIPRKYISHIDHSGEFDIQSNAVSYFYIYANKSWKLIHQCKTEKIPTENLLKLKTSIIQKDILHPNNSSSIEYNGVHKIIVETSIPSAEIARSKYSFRINQNKVNLSLVTYLNPPICDGDYIAVEKKGILELYYTGDELSCVSINPKFYIKKENNNFYLKIVDGREGIKEWLLMN